LRFFTFLNFANILSHSRCIPLSNAAAEEEDEKLLLRRRRFEFASSLTFFALSSIRLACFRLLSSTFRFVADTNNSASNAFVKIGGGGRRRRGDPAVFILSRGKDASSSKRFEQRLFTNTTYE